MCTAGGGPSVRSGRNAQRCCAFRATVSWAGRSLGGAGGATGSVASPARCDALTRGVSGCYRKAFPLSPMGELNSPPVSLLGLPRYQEDERTPGPHPQCLLAISGPPIRPAAGDPKGPARTTAGSTIATRLCPEDLRQVPEPDVGIVAGRGQRPP